jgi:ligand-binding SRPBCC domain-containing protein
MRFNKETVIHATPERVFAFHELLDAFERLIPPWENARVVQKADISQLGSQAIVEIKLLGLFPVRWVAEHTVYEPPHLFEDIQVSGPFASWRHRHIVEPHENGAVLRDEIEYEPPMWLIGDLVAPFAIVPKLQKMFEYRHNVTKKWCENE